MARNSKSKTTPSTKPPTIPPPDAPTLNQENFEKELKALASKAQEETWSKWALEQLYILFQSATLLTLAAISSNVSQLTLSPVYGSYPSSIWHSKAVMAACFAGWSGNLFIRRRLQISPSFFLPLLAAYFPTTQYVLFKLSGYLGANYGPLITESVALLPLIMLSVSCTATVLERLDVSPGRWPWLSESAPGVLSFVFFRVVENFSGKIINDAIGASFLQTRVGLQILLTGLYTILAPSKLLLFALPAALHTAFLNVHVQTPYAMQMLNGTLNANGWSLLDRQESLTGYISVIESKQNGFRLMRCDHSLLGGEWLRHDQTKLAEPVYAIFVQLEAIRLVEVPNPVPDNEATALVIGLGIGTTPAALMAHGITTTIVEIDPVVYNYAVEYFALPSYHTPVIEDAVSYAARVAKTSQKFDYIVHDVFTGGAEPVDLFTLEFLQDLHMLLKPGGVIALNYAGDLLLPSSRIVLRTILTTFPNCVIYREHAAPPPSKLAIDKRDFSNVMLFCTSPPSPSSPAPPVTFRKPVAADYLGSRMREMMLMPTVEVRFDELERGADGKGGEKGEGLLMRNGTEKFREWQLRGAMGHWDVMRTVLPAEIWEGW